MRDHDHGCPSLFFKFFHKRQYLGLDRHIQCRGGLVGDQDIRVAGQGNGNNHPLLHSAGKLMGIFAHSSGLDSHCLQHGRCPLIGVCQGNSFIVELDDFRDLVSHREHRV